MSFDTIIVNGTLATAVDTYNADIGIADGKITAIAASLPHKQGQNIIDAKGKYVFPGGMLPSRSAFRKAASRQGLQVTDEFAFGLDYARTLAEWRNAFDAHWPQIAPLGFDESFRRLWRLYLSYCEAGFLAGNIDVVQFELTHR